MIVFCICAVTAINQLDISMVILETILCTCVVIHDNAFKHTYKYVAVTGRKQSLSARANPICYNYL